MITYLQNEADFDELIKGEKVVIDFYADGTFYTGDVTYGNNDKYDIKLYANKWYELHFPKAKFSSGDGRFFIFMGTQSIGNIYIDNIRINHAN